MNRSATTFDSVYPDFLRAGLWKLSQVEANRELLAFFSALEHFRRDLHEQDCPEEVLAVTHRYVAGLNLFQSAGFWLVNPADFSFELTLASPEKRRSALQVLVDDQIKSGKFAQALRQETPVFFQADQSGTPVRCALHSLTLSRQVMGLFCGVLLAETAAHDIEFSLLSLLLGGAADALATLRKTKQLVTQVETLSNLLPLCAWCKKVRNDGGYWEQIEKYITTNSGTSITHGICPECKSKFLAGAAKAA